MDAGRHHTQSGASLYTFMLRRVLRSAFATVGPYKHADKVGLPAGQRPPANAVE